MGAREKNRKPLSAVTALLSILTIVSMMFDWITVKISGAALGNLAKEMVEFRDVDRTSTIFAAGDTITEINNYFLQLNTIFESIQGKLQSILDGIHIPNLPGLPSMPSVPDMPDFTAIIEKMESMLSLANMGTEIVKVLVIVSIIVLTLYVVFMFLDMRGSTWFGVLGAFWALASAVAIIFGIAYANTRMEGLLVSQPDLAQAVQIGYTPWVYVTLALAVLNLLIMIIGGAVRHGRR
jgi:hypothetical protein